MNMQATAQCSSQVNPVPDTVGRAIHTCPRLTKAEINARFIDVEDSRRSVLEMVERFYKHPQA